MGANTVGTAATATGSGASQSQTASAPGSGQLTLQVFGGYGGIFYSITATSGGAN